MIRLPQRHRAPLALLALVLSLGLTACGSSSATTTTAKTGPCTYPPAGQAAKPVKAPGSTPDPTAPTSMTISTNQGDIPITFEPTQAPCTVNSFVSLAQQGYYDNTPCHRLSTQDYYILQCGDPTGTGRGGPGYSYADELVANDPRLQPCSGAGTQQVCTYNAGTIAMANAGPDTNGSQFFVLYGNSQFPPAYTIIGHMDAAGLAVVKKIASGGIVGSGAGDGAPKTPVTITSVK